MKSKKKTTPSRRVGKKAKTYQIFGIFDFKKNTLLSVSLNQEEIEMEFDIEGYDDEYFGVVKFEVMVV